MKISSPFITGMLAIAISISAFAQTPSEREKIKSSLDLNKINQLKQEVEVDFEKKRAVALEIAQQKGWPESYETENGGVGYLVDVVDGEFPIYLQTTNLGAVITARANHVHTGGSSGLDLNGENMLAGVWDGGKVRESHQLLEGRAVHIDNATSFSSHATHVTGTVIGSEEFQNGTAKGMAPAAETINYAFNTGNVAAEVLAAINDHGLLVSNHSYGVPADGGSGSPLPVYLLGKYDNSARLWDQIQFASPYHLPVWAAGNDRGTAHNNQGDLGFDLLTGQSNSKNNLVVAATFQVLNYINANSVNMATFSSWGPTDDGRIKPDISAKGVNTFSSTASTDASYANFSGTSMAAPSVAGALLLLQQHYNNVNSEFMLASTLRGLVIHTADEAGSDPGPDYRFGWGLINTERAASVISNNGTSSTIMELTLNDGDGFEITGQAIPGERLVATIAWTDKQGSITSGQIEDDDTPMLINDLDIRATDENQDTFFPWILDHIEFTDPATTGDNYRDNVEKIEIDEASGTYTFNVSHKGSLDGGQQVMSLIISGMENVVLGTPSNEFAQTSIYPNPASSELNVKAITQISTIEIMNVLGQSMGVYDVESNSTKLDVAHLNSGTYFVRVTIDNASKVYKFIKR